MSNIHNNSLLQNSSSNRSLKANDAQNNSNGMGSSGYFYVGKDKKDKDSDDDFTDKSDYLFGALLGLSTINSVKISSEMASIKSLANLGTLTSFAHV